MRNKPFIFFDELSRIFDKDRATGNESTSELNALEELEEEVKEPESDQVYNLMRDQVPAEGDELMPNRGKILVSPSKVETTTKCCKLESDTMYHKEGTYTICSEAALAHEIAGITQL
ncbi:hypothetical protein ACET3Z_010582 [Daucus carota]